MNFINSGSAPKPGGHYSQAVEHNGWIFVAGQLPIKLSGEKELGEIEAQASLVMGNIQKILEAAGSDLRGVVKSTIYITDISLWTRVNEVYKEKFGEHRPARVVVPVPNLHYGFKIEMDVIAVQTNN
jgi:2-iminobutanoate/2-iminopropanoate deaminase